MVSGLKKTAYEDRLKELGLLPLEERRHKADMGMMHKIMRNDVLDSRTWFTPAGASGHGTRIAAHAANVKVKSGRLEVRRNFFSVRVARQWNAVPSLIKQAPSACRFKNEYRRHWDKMIVA